MWKDTHLVEGDMEMRVDVEARLSSRMREAEQWRLVRGRQSPSRVLGVFLGNLWSLIVDTLRPLLVASPEPQEDCG